MYENPVSRAFLCFLCFLWPVAAVCAQEKAAPPLFEGLGSFGRQITTASPQAQRPFNPSMLCIW